MTISERDAHSTFHEVHYKKCNHTADVFLTKLEAATHIMVIVSFPSEVRVDILQQAGIGVNH